jgi:predicted DNA-binding transcriptional regulator YafY
LIEILRHVPKGRGLVTAKAIRQQLAAQGYPRDIRTIQRHLDTLSAHFDIERDERSKPYGYRWNSDARALTLPQLTPQESVLLKFAYAQLKSLLPTNLRKDLNGFFDHAEHVLNQQSNARLDRQWLQKVRIVPTSQPLLPPNIDNLVLDAVSTALYENRFLEIRYQNAHGQVKDKARVMPLGLAQQGLRIYLVCQFDGYDNYRNLALHRIQQVTVMDEHYDYPDDFDLELYDRNGHFGFGDGTRIKIIFSITKDAGYYLTETPLSADQQIDEYEDYYRITATVIDSMMLTGWLRGWGENIWDVAREPGNEVNDTNYSSG